MLPCYVILDLETTGASAARDRVTEIAAVRMENGAETRRWSTLINPGLPIPHYIQSLTGISNAMVRGAPGFAANAQELLALLNGAVLVAHNARFDHGFLLAELDRLNISLQVATLCTVQLSRRLYPQHKGHGLSALIERHALQSHARHRAMGDVESVLDFLRHAQQDLGLNVLQRHARALVQNQPKTSPTPNVAPDPTQTHPGARVPFAS